MADASQPPSLQLLVTRCGYRPQGSLDDFWSQATPPDMELVRDYVRLLAGAVHIRGGYYTAEGLALAVPATVQRLEEGLPWLPPRVSACQSAKR